MYRRAAESGEDVRAYNIRRALEAIHQLTTDKLDELTTKYGALDALSTQAMQPGPARVRPATIATPPVIDASTTVAPAGRLDIPGPEHRIVPEATHAFPEPAGGLIQAKGVPGPPPASSLPGASLSETGGAQAGDLGRWRLDPPAIGTTAAEPVATEAIVAPSLAEMSSFWLQPVTRCWRRAPSPSTPACTTRARPCNRLPSPPRRAAPRLPSLPALRSSPRRGCRTTSTCTMRARPCNRLSSPPRQAAPRPLSLPALRSSPRRGCRTTSTSSAPSSPPGSPRGSMRHRSSSMPAGTPSSGSSSSGSSRNSPRAGSPCRPSMY